MLKKNGGNRVWNKNSNLVVPFKIHLPSNLQTFTVRGLGKWCKIMYSRLLLAPKLKWKLMLTFILVKFEEWNLFLKFSFFTLLFFGWWRKLETCDEYSNLIIIWVYFAHHSFLLSSSSQLNLVKHFISFFSYFIFVSFFDSWLSFLGASPTHKLHVQAWKWRTFFIVWLLSLYIEQSDFCPICFSKFSYFHYK